MSNSKMFFLLTAVQKLFLKSQTSFSRVMITNVLPRFDESQRIHGSSQHTLKKLPDGTIIDNWQKNKN